MALYNDYESLFERFSIMTIDGKVQFDRALQYCIDNATPQLAEQFKHDVLQNKESSIKLMCESYVKLTKEGHDGNTLLNNWKKNTPSYIYNDFLKALNLHEPSTTLAEGKADFETLEKYINAGFALFPCIYNPKANKYLPITLNGKIALYDTDEQKQAKERHGITDKDTLQALCNQSKTIVDEYNREHKIELFRIFPLDNKYIVIDIDTHDGKANGLVQWNNYIKQKHLENNPIYNNPANFPCYVESANGGLHLYFKMQYELPSKIKDIASSVEVCTKDHGETCAGSYRQGTKNNHYILHGSFENAPYLPKCIYDDIQQPLPQPAINNQFNTSYNKGTGTKWNQSLEGIIEKARQKNGEGNHNLISLICHYAKKANEQDGTHYTKNEILNALFTLPEVIDHENKDKGDTQGVINSYF